MPRYKVTVKSPFYSAGQCIEPGMFVEISSIMPMICVSSINAAQVASAFQAKYGIDLKAMGCLNSGFLRMDRI